MLADDIRTFAFDAPSSLGGEYPSFCIALTRFSECLNQARRHALGSRLVAGLSQRLAEDSRSMLDSVGKAVIPDGQPFWLEWSARDRRDHGSRRRMGALLSPLRDGLGFRAQLAWTSDGLDGLFGPTLGLFEVLFHPCRADVRGGAGDELAKYRLVERSPDVAALIQPLACRKPGSIEVELDAHRRLVAEQYQFLVCALAAMMAPGCRRRPVEYDRLNRRRLRQGKLPLLSHEEVDV